MRSTMGRKAYPSDLTDKQWDLLGPLIPLPSLEGKPPTVERREIVNATGANSPMHRTISVEVQL